MKKTISLVALSLCSMISFSQAKFSIFGGPQVTSANYTINGVTQPTEYQKDNFTAGVGLRFPFEGVFYFSPHLYYSRKGYQVEFNAISHPPDSSAINNKTSIHTIELAPLFQFAFSKKPSHLFLRFGPAIDLNISGRETFETNSGNIVEREMQFSYINYGFATTSANVHLGYQSRFGFQIFAHYAHGLGSLNNFDDGPKIKHKIAGVSLGWTFGTKTPW